jgi:DNA-binding response OmpR family regulator
VTRDNRLAPLTLLEFRVLLELVKAGGRVMTRDSIIDEAWGHGTAITDRVVDNHVLNIRKKLERDGQRPYVLSVRGLGYRFDDQTLPPN